MRAQLLVLALLLAGCSEPTETPDEPFDASLDDELEATAETGVIRGVVVDAAIVPVAGVTVTIDGLDQETTSNEAGAFGFDGLEPGKIEAPIRNLLCCRRDRKR